MPFEVAGVKRDIRVAAFPDDNVDCYLGANVIKAFSAVHDPDSNQLFLRAADRHVDLELAGVSTSDALQVSSIGLEDVTEGQRAQMLELVSKILWEKDEALGCTTWIKHNIDVGSARPIKQRYYPVSKKIEEEMHRQVQEMLELGVIEQPNSAWSSPVVMVCKGVDKYRFCIDFRILNAISRADAYPFPCMDAILRKLRCAKFISTLDLSAAYHQIRLTRESRELTAFTVPGMGLFEFKRMPYGVSCAGATFQRLIDKVIGPELKPFAFSYLDDIIIGTETYEEHIKWLKHVLRRIREAGLTINREKSVFGKIEVKYLGVLVNGDGFRSDPEKIEQVINCPVPRNLKQLRRFMGMASWYRKCLADFATIAEPLSRTSLTKKDRRYEWGAAQQEAFERVKALIASAPVLTRLSFDTQFIVQTDASDTGIGAVLLQVIGGQERVLEFASRTLSSAEPNYNVTERDCLAMVWGI